MKKFLVISTLLIVCTQLVGLCANSSLGPLSQYCKKIKPLFIKISKSVPNSDTITIELQVNSHGQVLQTQLSKSSEGSKTNKEIVLQQVKHLKQLEAPPVGTSCPLWLSVDLCNQLDQVCVSVRDLDWKSYMEEVQKRVKQTSVKQHSFPTTSSARKVVTLFFKVHQDGNISKYGECYALKRSCI